MNPIAILAEEFASLAEASPIVALIVRWTVLLALAWLSHWGLSGRNPRWQVMLWRVTVVGIVLIAALSWAPPLVKWRLASTSQGIGSNTALERASETRPAAQGLLLQSPPTTSRDSFPDFMTESGGFGSTRIANQGKSAVVPPIEIATGPPAARAQSLAESLLRLTPWLLSAWALGVVLVLARLALAMHRLHRIIRRAPEAPEWVVRECQEIADQLGGVPALRVLRSAEVASPCLAGFVRPILLLPDHQCHIDAQDDLSAIAMHEIAHARGHDVLWNLGAHLASAVLWFHPLAWQLRTAHAAACDAVCDAVAVGHLGDVAKYAKTLARLALQAVTPPFEPGVAMARTPDVLHRINALNTRVFKTPLPQHFVIPVMLAGAGLVTFIGGLGFTRADEATKAEPVKAEAESAQSKPSIVKPDVFSVTMGITSIVPEVKGSLEGFVIGTGTGPARPKPSALKPEPSAKMGRLEIRAIAAETGTSLEGVSISYYAQINGRLIERMVSTDRDGKANLEWPAEATITYLRLTASKPKFVPIHLDWNSANHPVTLPAFKELKFVRGTKIGGLVRDEAGQPIAGAQIQINARTTVYGQSNTYFPLGTPKTDDQGRWSLDEAPANLAEIMVMRVEHPQYQRNLFTFRSLPRRLGSLTVLKKGYKVRGHVVDLSGNPIKGAKATCGHYQQFGDPKRTTDEHGDFTLERCDRGPSIVTVQAEGFAPELLEVQVEEQTAPLEFRLRPGATLRAKVVDPQGKPIAGAYFTAATWRSSHAIQFQINTDKDGHAEWRSAPKDAVLFNVGKVGYFIREFLPLTASDQEQVITLDPALTISGHVTDAESGRLVPDFQVIPGSQPKGGTNTDWIHHNATRFNDGQYTFEFDGFDVEYRLRVEAPGYKPIDSRSFLSKEGKATYDFALQRGEELKLSGIVLNSDGHAAAEVQVALATSEKIVVVEQGHFGMSSFPVVETGPDGRFTLPFPNAPNGKFHLIALSEAGFAELTSEQFAQHKTLKLKPWGKVEGLALIGRKPAAYQEISFRSNGPNALGPPSRVFYSNRTQTDEQGRFALEHVISGPGHVSRIVRTEHNSHGAGKMPCWSESVDVKPAATTEVRLGGKGRPVSGRVVLEGNPKVPFDGRQNDPVVIEKPRSSSVNNAFTWSLFASNLDKEGRFRVEDVPAGQYELTVSVNTHLDPQFHGGKAKVGYATLSITVPEGPQDEPIDLGDVTAKPPATPKPNDKLSRK